MTTVTLPAPPQPTPPLQADPGSIRADGEQLLTASAQVDDLGTFVADGARIGDWHGRGGSAYAAAITPIGRRADAMSLGLRSVAQRVLGHAEEMARLHDQRGVLAGRRHELISSLDQLRGEIADATDADAARLQADADHLGVLVGDLDTDRGKWAADVAAEERAMVHAFERVMRIDQVVRHYDGVADPADGALAAMPPPGAGPQAVNAWWSTLTHAQQLAIIAAAPGAIGNLDGIPAASRDQANATRLDRDLAALEERDDAGVLTDMERGLLDNVRAADEAREAIESSVDPVTYSPVEAQIYLYDPGAFDGDGAIGIAAGDLDTADNVAVAVPGFGTDAQSAAYLGHRTIDMYDAARNLDPGATNATMFWIGYDAPDNLPILDTGDGDAIGTLQEGAATAGGDRLADTIDGLRASRDGNPAHLTVVGHSYGSTTLGHAAHDHGLPADDLVVVGSPGLGGDTHHAGDLGIDPHHVWAGANSHDPIAYLADDGWVGGSTFGGVGLGDDPVEDDFGANRFEAESTTRSEDFTYDGHPYSLGDHNKYFHHDTESLYDITQIVNGDYDAVHPAGPVHDPWYGGPEDPEGHRTPTAPDTNGAS